MIPGWSRFVGAALEPPGFPPGVAWKELWERKGMLGNSRCSPSSYAAVIQITFLQVLGVAF
jgi:hypothetical protein